VTETEIVLSLPGGTGSGSPGLQNGTGTAASFRLCLLSFYRQFKQLGNNHIFLSKEKLSVIHVIGAWEKDNLSFLM